MFLSLDGVMENPAWSMPYWNDEIAQIKGDEFSASDAQLLGRVTYQGFAAAWPGRTNADDPGAEIMNSMRKYVVSTTLEKVEWNNSHLIGANVVDEITRLKQQPGRDILVSGSATLVQTLMQHDLVDEYHLLVYPVVVGLGKRLFQEGSTATLALIEARALPKGVVLLRYQPNRENR
jgi:dihydrofolate reductase